MTAANEGDVRAAVLQVIAAEILESQGGMKLGERAERMLDAIERANFQVVERRPNTEPQPDIPAMVLDGIKASVPFYRAEVEKHGYRDTPYGKGLLHPWAMLNEAAGFIELLLNKRRAQPAELSTDDYMRLVEWMRSKPRRRANTAFTAGLLRSIAYAVEHAEQPAEAVDEAKEMEERVKEALWRDWVDRTGWKRESAKLGCGAALEHGQHWRFCGETDMGQTLPALCKECGGEYARARGGR